jgi:hypothetical protein
LPVWGFPDNGFAGMTVQIPSLKSGINIIICQTIRYKTMFLYFVLLLRQDKLTGKTSLLSFISKNILFKE